MVKYISILSIVISLVSCSSNTVFNTYKTLDNNWNKDHKISFKINTNDTVTPHNLYINLRNNNHYKYSNLFLIVEMNFPNGKTITDTLEYKMAKPNGEFLGSGFSDLKENKLWYKEAVVFNEAGDYTVNIQHAMRENGAINGITNLKGITQVGFNIEKAN